MLHNLLAYGIPIVIGIVVVLVVASACYTVAPTDKVLVITGPGGRRFVTGKAAVIVPFIMRRDWLSLGVVQSNLQTDQSIPTKDALLIDVTAVANFQIGVKEFTDKDGNAQNPLEIAARNYLNQPKDKMMQDVTQVLLGKMREAIGKTELRTLMENRDEFSETVARAAEDDMRALGLELVTFNVQDFSDQQGVIEDMGAEMASQITRDAQLARIASEEQVAMRQNQLDLKQAELKTKADEAKAAADMVYETTRAQKTKDLNIAEQDAEIAAEDRKIELAQKKAEVRERELDAEVRKKAEADRFAAQERAEAELFEERKRAEAIEVKAAAEAKSIEMKGRAEGTALAETGKGEAEAIKAQGEAYNAMNNTFILTQQYIAILPEIARAVAEPLTKVDKITMYGEGNASKLVGDTTNTMSQLNEAFEKALGIDLSSLISSVAGGNAAGAAIAKHIGETADAAEAEDGAMTENDFAE